MPALEAGALAPNISLPTTDGQPFSLVEARRKGPVLLAFFKINCPTCQYAFPLIERLHQAHPGVTVVGISQNDKRDTTSFMKEYGVTFPVALDEPSQYPASNAYGLTNVPTLFLVSAEGKIQVSSVGWAKVEMEEIHARLTEPGSKGAAPLFKPGEEIATFKAG